MVQDAYPGSIHVRDVGLGSAIDEQVWSYAVEHEFVIISKDSDFHQRSLIYGIPPKIVWVRRGNCSTLEIIAIMKQAHAAIETFMLDSNASFLVVE